MALSIEYLKKHEDKANALFGVFASGYSTIMFTKEILLKSIGLSLSAVYTSVILSLIAFHFFLDKYVFDFIERQIRQYYKEDFELSLDDRENVKFVLLLIIAAVCIFGFNIYIIPIVLLLFQSGYFLNFYLQKGFLSDTLAKIFYTQDNQQKSRLFLGFIQFEENGQSYTLSKKQTRMLYLGAGLCFIFATTMVALAAKWLIPFITNIAYLGSLLSPIGFVFVPLLMAYGVILYFFMLRSFAQLIQLDAVYKDKGGLFSFQVMGEFLWQVFCERPYKIMQTMTEHLSQGLVNLYYVFFKNQNKTRLQAGKEVGVALALLAWNGVCLVWEIVKIGVRVAIGVLSFIGMYYTHGQGGEAIGQTVDSKITGKVFTVASSIAQSPQMAMSTSTILNPQENKNEVELHSWSLARIKLYLFSSVLRSGLVFNGGEMPSRADGRTIATATGTMAASGVILNRYVPENFAKVNAATQSLCVRQYQEQTKKCQNLERSVLEANSDLRFK